MPGRTREPHGIVLALWPGNSGAHRTARHQSCVAYKLGAVGYQADVYGKPLRLTTVFRCFKYGANTAIYRGQSCSTFGACQTFRS
jgi:hypothetical protein